MSEQKHTPLPWKIGVTPLTIKATCNGIVIADVRGHDTRLRGKERMEDIEYCQGNAALIVRAVNSHQELIELARHVVAGDYTSEELHCMAFALLVNIDPPNSPTAEELAAALDARAGK